MWHNRIAATQPCETGRLREAAELYGNLPGSLYLIYADHASCSLVGPAGKCNVLSPSKIGGTFDPITEASRNHMPAYCARALSPADLSSSQSAVPALRRLSFFFLLLQNFAKFCCKNVNSVTKFTVQHSGAPTEHKKTQVALHLSYRPKGSCARAHRYLSHLFGFRNI